MDRSNEQFRRARGRTRRGGHRTEVARWRNIANGRDERPRCPIRPARAIAADPNDPEQNIDAGTRLLHELLIKYDGDVVKALAAYNAAPGAVDRYQGLPPYPETQNYVDKVIRKYKGAGR